MIKPDNVSSLLWFRADAIGDSVLAFSMLEQIKKQYPNARIVGLCQSFLGDVYNASPFFDEVIPLDKKAFTTDEQYHKKLLEELASYTFDLVINSTYSREEVMDPIATKIGAKKVIGFRVPRKGLRWDIAMKRNRGYTDLVTCPSPWISELEKYELLLDYIKIVRDKPLQPIMWVPQDAEEHYLSFVTENNLQDKKIITLFAGALSQQRIYPSYGKALNLFLAGKTAEYAVIALGGPNDTQASQKNIDDIKKVPAFNLCGKTSLLQVAAFIRNADCALGAETGLAHIACAMGINNVVLLGGGHFGRFMPYSHLTTCVSLPLTCFGCDWKCKYKKVYCVANVGADALAYGMEVAQKPSHAPKVILQKKSRYKKPLFGPHWLPNERVTSLQKVEYLFF